MIKSLKFTFIFTLLLLSFTTIVHGQEENRDIVLSVHVGSQSLDRNDNTEQEISELVNIVCRSIPYATHVTIATYWDYPDQIRMWFDAIHNCGKKAWLRSGGLNNWEQRNGVTEIGTPQQQIEAIESVVAEICDVLEPGDIIGPTPDEPSNGTYWEQWGSVGESEEAEELYNLFISEAYASTHAALEDCGKQGVAVDGVHDSPSAIKDVLRSETASLLPWIGTDNYPMQSLEEYTPVHMGMSLRQELLDWVVGVHGETDRCLTIGPSPYVSLSPRTQALAVIAELFAVIRTMPEIRCISVWQAGDVSNWPNNRLFENQGSEENAKWVPRPAALIVNLWYKSLTLSVRR